MHNLDIYARDLSAIAGPKGVPVHLATPDDLVSPVTCIQH